MAGVMSGSCMLCIEKEEIKEYDFYLSQIILFSLWGVGLFFALHKRIGDMLRISPLYFPIAFAFLEYLFLASLGNLKEKSDKVRSCIWKGLLFFILMLGMDVVAFLQIKLISVLGNLAKVWAGVFFFLFAWNMLSDKIVFLKNQGHSLTNLIVTRRTEVEKNQ
jgi:hypothetical protein